MCSFLVNMIEGTISSPYNLFSTSLSSSILLIIITPTLVILLQLMLARRSKNTISSKYGESSQANNNISQYPRQIQHVSTGLLFYILSFILPIRLAFWLLSTTTAVFYILHKARSKSNLIQQLYIQHFGRLLRDHERNIKCIPGAFWFLLGTTITLYSYKIDIARTCLLCLSFGDPIASFSGIKIKGPKLQLKYGTKSLVGCFCCFLTCAMVSTVSMDIKHDQNIWFITGFVATMMEVSSGITGIDDNILIPIGTGLILSLYIDL